MGGELFMNGLIAFSLSLIPFVILFIVEVIFFNLVIQIKRNSDIQVEQNKQIISLLEKRDKDSLND